MHRLSILVVVAAVLATSAFTFAPDQLVRFEPGSELVLGTEPVVVELVNDSPIDYPSVNVTATLGKPFEVEWPDKYGAFGRQSPVMNPPLPSGGSVRFLVAQQIGTEQSAT